MYVRRMVTSPITVLATPLGGETEWRKTIASRYRLVMTYKRQTKSTIHKALYVPNIGRPFFSHRDDVIKE